MDYLKGAVYMAFLSIVLAVAGIMTIGSETRAIYSVLAVDGLLMLTAICWAIIGVATELHRLVGLTIEQLPCKTCGATYGEPCDSGLHS